MHTVVQSEPGLWTVGYYQPDGSWCAMSDHNDKLEAHEYAARLNGAGTPPAPRVPAAGLDFQAASERHLEWLTTVPGVLVAMLMADEDFRGGDDVLPAPEPQPEVHPDIDEGPWDLYAWLCTRLGGVDGGQVWASACRYYDAVMAGEHPAPVEPEPEPQVDPVMGVPVGETIVLRCSSGGPLGPAIRATEWRTSDVGLLFLPVGGRWRFTPWRFIAQVEVAG